MPVDKETYKSIIDQLPDGTTLVAVSKTKPVEDILALYELGQRDFGENYVQELLDKQAALPTDIRWHFIGHLQSNKVKNIVPFVYLVHGVDSLKLLQEIDKQSEKINRTTNILLQVHIALEESKFGLDEKELDEILTGDILQPGKFQHIRICGLMGMATFTEDPGKVRAEFKTLKRLYDKFSKSILTFNSLSMGMSGDFKIALEEGSNMVRIGSLLFGTRNYS